MGIVLLLGTGHARAQGPAPESITLDVPRLSFSRAALAPAEPEGPSAQPDVDHRKRLRWGRALTAIGGTSLAAGVLQLALFGKNRCYEPEHDAPTFSRRAGGAAAAVGFAVTFTGAGLTFSVPKAERRGSRPTEEGVDIMAVSLTVGILALEALFLGAGLVELVSCASS